MSQIDLHIHSTASDGFYQPSALVKMAKDLGLKVISITDHDTVDGIPEALETAKSYPGLILIPGVEISTDIPDGEIHILGYFINFNDREFLARLNNMRNSRLERAQKMVKKLNELGFKIEWDRVRSLASGNTIGRPHIAQALMEKGYINTFKEAFERYIGKGGPAYVERDKMTPSEAVILIRKVGGLPVFAHPVTYKNYEGILPDLLNAGLIGLEAYYKDSTPEEISRMLGVAREYNLIPTGGSDYHGIEPNEVMMGGVEVPEESVNKLIKLAKEISRINLDYFKNW